VPEGAATRSVPRGSAEAATDAPRSRAGAYRQRRVRKRTPFRLLAAEIVVFLAVVGVIYLATAPKPATPPSIAPGGGNYPGQVRIALAPPAVANSSCGTAKSYTTEALRVNSTTIPLTTKEITLVVVELGDGDFINSASTPPVVTATDVCVNTPPSGGLSWYAVLIAPSGANLASFTYSQGWAPVPGAPFPGPVDNGSALCFVFAQSIAGLGYGVYVQGVENGPLVSGLGLF
jgi:hypothetical protein